MMSLAFVRTELLLHACTWHPRATLWVLATLSCSSAAAQDGFEHLVEITGESARCVSAPTLRTRIRELVARQGWPSDLQVRVQLGAAVPSFSVSKDGVVVAERHFARFSLPCAKRREALAVAIVLAVDNFREPLQGAEIDDSEPSASEPEPLARTAIGASEPLPPIASSPAAASGVEASAASAAAPSGQVQAALRSAPVQVEGVPARDTAEPPGGTQLPPRAATHVTLSAGGQWLWSAAPSGAAALAAGLELGLGPAWSLSIGGLWGPRAEHSLATRPERVSVQLFAGQLLGCCSAPTPGAAGLAVLQGCAGGLAGVLDAEGRGFARDQPATLAWAAFTLRAAAQWPASGALALRARADGRVNLLRPAPEAPEPRGFSAPVGVLGADLGLDILWRVD